MFQGLTSIAHPDSPTRDLSANSLRLGRNPQSLARINVIRILQERFVGLEDFLVFGALAVSVLRFRDLPQRVARLHNIEFRLRFGLRCDDVVFDLRHTLGVSNRENNFFSFSRRWSGAAQRHLAAVDFDINLGRIQAMPGDLFLQFFGGRPVVWVAPAGAGAALLFPVKKSNRPISLS